MAWSKERSKSGRLLVALLMALAVRLTAADYDEPPISYSASVPADAVAGLLRRLEDGSTTLEWDAAHGYLPAVLRALAVPAASQVLVFAKISLQRDQISPSTPRALYFNDEVYVGTVPDGGVIELAATDPRQGTMFYVLDARRGERPRPRRQTHECLQCHDANGQTGGVPGLVLRSTFTDRSGQPLLDHGSFTTDQASPWAERWGGWYVTGSHGRMRHLGNLLVDGSTAPEAVDREAGANLATLGHRIDPADYLEPGSDLVALLVLGHQARMHNLITRAGYAARLALRDEAAMNQALQRGADFRSDSTVRRIRSAGDELLRYLLFADEAQLPDPVVGSSAFAAGFAARGPHDGQGRSLRDLDLQHRLLRHRCSWLITSPAFTALPAPLKDHLYGRLRAILLGTDASGEYAYLGADERAAILAILLATDHDLPASWR